MFRLSQLRRSTASFYEFADPAFLNNKRPTVPGGAWPVDSLRKKSTADLQQIWFQLVKERNMLTSTQEHYTKHQEELGAMPAPSRIKMVRESMANIKQVVKERDFEATDKATAIFKERVAKGVYRYPPGPPLPPGTDDTTCVVRVTLSAKVPEERMRQLFGKYNVFEPHKGIVKVDMTLREDAMAAKEQAERAWEEYRLLKSDSKEYHKWAQKPSAYDYTEVEIAPGVYEPLFADGESAVAADSPSSSSSGVIKAAEVPVPAPKPEDPLPTATVERLRFQQKPDIEKTVIQLGYFPNITMEPIAASAGERPVHPDEITGPWTVDITYDAKDGVAYAKALNITKIDGVDVHSIEDVTPAPKPHAATCPIYQEAVRKEMAEEETMYHWPHVPEWKHDYRLWTKKSVADIVAYNYSNVLDYVDREVLLTGKSVWEAPIEIDYTCGNAKSVPVHAKPNKPEFGKPRVRGANL